LTIYDKVVIMQRIIRKIISYSLIVPCFVVGCCMVPVIVFAAWFGEIEGVKSKGRKLNGGSN
jgi:hypothetical protein